ncbi:phosphotransferase family protein [Microbacterium sp. NIBRBAC000506063]|uniref:phosphotransferase family protein n=1 Tax=Microbacterium sp. NIBRBAC000506063 TaxID=2734618 RepID=UPI001BB739A0|nr:phosphotransferase family protein [Microbacterium sp. NIBRBAC000506063]QTV79322.1 phosphotransferase family protein [Microbacterium sp. NIBRBAC000506063]
MNSHPDGVEVVATVEEARELKRPPILILDSLQRYLEQQGLGEGPLSWRRIGEGQSNFTYLIRCDSSSFVLRRGPRPPHPVSTHDMIREARIQRLLSETEVPVPNILSVCKDSGVLGVPFYIMDFLDGTVITERSPVALDSMDQRRAVGMAAVDTLAGLHLLDVREEPLITIGRPDGYLERQIQRFSALWPQTASRSLSAVREIGDWLASRIPVTQRDSVVHGDYRLGNLMYARNAPAQVTAILDWEMSTLGDPLADLGYLIATYAAPDRPLTPIQLTSVTREPGYPSRDELVQRYSDLTGLDMSGLAWYQVLALWKAAIFCEAIYSRWLQGQRPGDAFAPTLEAGVPRCSKTQSS